ncbi:hypothetical protein RclHR1_10820004 [Rhizophagus clarus]|uniref:Endonuclease/exonuclease/phosphatase domain-containing protein n=1 Tax=Rhizophagus clarus TaxID=94130 RepID=A0A2Z6QTZ8_9GLOM|nr:hypothetical protein RclHR1_10820004 [Rhizophagus clarus]
MESLRGWRVCANSTPSPTYLTFWGPCHFGNGTTRSSSSQELVALLQWCHDYSFDFMGIAETNANITNLQHYIKDTFDDCSSARHYEGHTLTDSDHDIVTINIYLPDIFPIAYKNTQPITSHNPNFRDLLIKTEDITSDHWTKFEAHISDSAHTFGPLINTLNSILDPLDSPNHSQRAMKTIDKCWADIKEILISAAAHTLPLRKRNKLHPKLKPKDRSPDMKNWINIL